MHKINYRKIIDYIYIYRETFIWVNAIIARVTAKQLKTRNKNKIEKIGFSVHKVLNNCKLINELN